MFTRLAMILALAAALTACSPSGGSSPQVPGSTASPAPSTTPTMSPSMGLESVAPTQ